MDEFLKYSPVYGNEIEREIEGEFCRLQDNHFLDHTGGTLYSEKQLNDIFDDLKTSLLCNPHGKNGPSQQTEDIIDILRFRILQHFHTNSEEYSVVFTSNATAALKIIAENFDYGPSNKIGTFVYLEDNHTSVLGMRNYSTNIKPLTVDDAFSILHSKFDNENKGEIMGTNSIFVYPAQSNFSGTKYPLTWIELVKNGKLNDFIDKPTNWYVLLDAASFVGTNDLDLSKYKPDFVPISFYKIFGYPTGIGALLVKNSSQQILKKKYYGGGTVSMALALENMSVFRKMLNERFEDGTIPYLSIVALNHGFETFSRLKLSMNLVSEHTFNLARYVYKNLISLHHSNGKPAVILYHDTIFENCEHQGGIVNFNLVRENGDNIGYAEVMHMANLHNIHVRTGCSCNPGACQRHLKLTSDDVKKHFQAGHVCGDQNDLIDGIPTGSVRVSFGYMSRKKDADALLHMIENCFVKKPIIRKIPVKYDEIKQSYKNKFLHETQHETRIPEENKQCDIFDEPKVFSKQNSQNGNLYHDGVLENIFLYPIKSCGAFSPSKSWSLSSSGLKYDRKWMIVNKSGACLTQKQYPEMCLIKPFINLENNEMILSFPDEDSISLPLHDPERRTFWRCESKICRDKVIGYDCGNAVGQWLNKCLSFQGLRLIEQIDEGEARISKQGETLQLSFANQSQYLMVNMASIKWLRDRVKENDEEYIEDLESILLRFRPNIVVNFGEPFVEDQLESIVVGNANFKTVGSCTRCQMICINQVNAQKTKEPLITLSRVMAGRVKFGVYLCHNFERENVSLNIGNRVVAEKKATPE